MTEQLSDLARPHTAAAIAALVAALDCPGERVAAAVALLLYAYGPPPVGGVEATPDSEQADPDPPRWLRPRRGTH